MQRVPWLGFASDVAFDLPTIKNISPIGRHDHKRFRRGSLLPLSVAICRSSGAAPLLTPLSEPDIAVHSVY